MLRLAVIGGNKIATTSSNHMAPRARSADVRSGSENLAKVLGTDLASADRVFHIHSR